MPAVLRTFKVLGFGVKRLLSFSSSGLV